MKKTVTVNISGVVFTLDEDAFSKLKKYLDTIKSYFSTSGGRDEIMADIESRIAEMLVAKLTNDKNVVTITDIDGVIEQLGQPEDFREVADESDYEENTSQRTTYSSNNRKRFYRDEDNQLIGGVCSGFSHYTGIDVVWVRLILAAAIIVYGTGLLLYILLWIIVPSAKTTAEKLEMRGEPVNFDTIGKSVEEEIGNLKDNLNSYREKHVNSQWIDKLRDLLSDLIGFIGSFFKAFFKILGKIIGAALFIGGIVGTFVLLASLLGVGSFENPALFGYTGELQGYSINELNNVVFDNSSELWLAIIGFFLLCGIPTLAVAYAGYALLIAPRKAPRTFGWSILGLWISGLLLTIYSGFSTVAEFKKSGAIEASKPLAVSDTLKLSFDGDFNGEDFSTPRNNEFYFLFNEEGRFLNEIDFNIVRSSSELAEVNIRKTARGSSIHEAELTAQNTSYDFQYDSTSIHFSPIFMFDTATKWRSQRVSITLFIPNGTTIYLDGSTKHYIDDIKNKSNTWDPEMVYHYWTMTEEGLSSPDFEIPKNNSEFEAQFDKAEEAFIEINTDIKAGDVSIQSKSNN